MKITQEIPNGQIEVLRRALTNELMRLESIGVHDQDIGYEIFDIRTLLGLLNSKIVVELTKEEYDNFTSNNGIDFPTYVDGNGFIYPVFLGKESDGKFKKFARKCNATGKGMNEGFCFNDGEYYCISELDALNYARSIGYETLEEAHEEEVYYWTEWSVDDEDEYYDSEGNLFSFE